MNALQEVIADPNAIELRILAGVTKKIANSDFPPELTRAANEGQSSLRNFAFSYCYLVLKHQILKSCVLWI